jgi:Mrp family chromosome partitioning ATPase
MEPQHLLRTIRRRWRPIALLAIVGAALGTASAAVAEDAAPAPVPTVYYDACHTLLVDTAIPSNLDVWGVQNNLGQIAQTVTQGAIPQATAESLNADAEALSNRVRVVVRNDIQSLTVCTVGVSPSDAEAGADEFAAQLMLSLEGDAAEFHEERLAAARDRVAIADSCLADAEEAIAGATTLGATGTELRLLQDEWELCNSQHRVESNSLKGFENTGAPIVPLDTLESAASVEISEWAYNSRVRSGAAGSNVENTTGELASGSGAGSSNSSKSSPTIPDGPLSRAGAGALFGAALGFGFVMFTDRLDSKLRSKSDVETTLDLPVLAEIPPLSRSDRKSTRILTLEEPRSRTAESFRALRSALDYARRVDDDQGRGHEGAHVILVTSAAPSEGKTTTVANLATVMAEGDRSVLAINCDFRRPRLHRYLGGTANPQRLNITEVPGVQLVTQVTENDGDSTPSDVVAAQCRLVTRAMERFDVIILDTAPILTTNDAADLLGVSDHVVLVVNGSETSAESAARASELLERRGRAPLGVALVGARDVPNASDYYYEDGDPYLEPSRRRRRSAAVNESGVEVAPSR